MLPAGGKTLSYVPLIGTYGTTSLSLASALNGLPFLSAFLALASPAISSFGASTLASALAGSSSVLTSEDS